eukprot:CAMPEP_0113568386 /NCGR_PEP_ID=MMETSP0015_2-20120614/23819_1 /TAXON_ID=2838 /ORGANISM="Odontella" /LENGTH=86 /DNA_ID=CAMNT_0000470919 /DNA_START=132 /DNA_END=392 /DNA_ORIENTATION=+ /assembly_acc=CAM_ASM_000160
MKFLCVAGLLASAAAFQAQPAAFTTQSHAVGGSVNGAFSAAEGTAHRNRRATIVMDGKANASWEMARDGNTSSTQAPAQAHRLGIM